MLLSLCIPCHKRLDDLRQTMPHLVAAANGCPPVEVTVVCYGLDMDLCDYLETVRNAFTGGSYLNVAYYTKRDYYHMAHARNLSVRASVGAYIVIMSADIYPGPAFLPTVRQALAEQRDVVWMHDNRYKGVIVCRRDEFIATGGYDERFEFYGPEDRDLDDRLHRRGAKLYRLPDGLLHVIRTPDEVKVQNYRLPLSKAEMSARMRPIYNENKASAALVANQGKEWGRW